MSFSEKKCNIESEMEGYNGKEFVNDTISCLEQYFLRNNSESGFSTDKRWFGWDGWTKKG
jgi:transposase